MLRKRSQLKIVLPLSASGLIRPDIELLHQARVLVEILAGETRKILRQASGDLRRALVEMRPRAAVGQRLADGGIQARDQCRWSAERNECCIPGLQHQARKAGFLE